MDNGFGTNTIETIKDNYGAEDGYDSRTASGTGPTSPDTITLWFVMTYIGKMAVKMIMEVIMEIMMEVIMEVMMEINQIRVLVPQKDLLMTSLQIMEIMEMVMCKVAPAPVQSGTSLGNVALTV